MAEKRKKTGGRTKQTAQERPITPMERLAVYELLAQGPKPNQSAACAAAGYKSDNLSALASTASRVFKRPQVQAEIEKLQARRAKKLDVTADRIELELARIAFSDIRNVVRISDVGVFIRPTERPERFGADGVAEGDVADVSLVSDDAAAALSEASQTATPNGTNVKVKLWDKLEALKLLMQRHGLLVEQSNNVNTNLSDHGIPALKEMTVEQLFELMRLQRARAAAGGAG